MLKNKTIKRKKSKLRYINSFFFSFYNIHSNKFFNSLGNIFNSLENIISRYPKSFRSLNTPF